MQCICNLFIEKIDYKGQELAKKIMMIVYILGYTMSLIAGYTLGDLKYVLYGGIATVILVVLLVVPSWPFYRKNLVVFGDKEKEKED
ncbi:microsomal signal peptidase Spc12 [Hamiltosporidium tvaerminnensis]|uniref:Signal peptidase complex subunit 1 n=1 Tax=Hamiltosporidium tvaerminnensis TaxID=1176355 RepID=A0A4Q9LQQ6_9MICR|nr:microsomal signal peptidase Spc12 [Hamiltosporidium tvaerminnensis]